MKNITKQDLIHEASVSSGHTQLETRAVAEQFMKVVVEMLYKEKTVEIRGFGTFFTKERKPRPARNPRTGEICPLDWRRAALFRFSPEVREHIREVPELQEAAAAEAARFGETLAHDGHSQIEGSEISKSNRNINYIKIK